VFQKLSHIIDDLADMMAYWSGAAFLLLSLYITYDSLARFFGFPFSGITDEISSYVLAVAGTWGMAYGLKVGAHVRIDLVIAHVGPWLRRALDLWAGAVTMCFAAILSYYTWGAAYEAFELGTKSITILQAPLAIPQALVAVGFTLLTIQGASMLLRGTVTPVGGDLV
jgi:TRAP-type mannitol/chloroaromatic compound transport system permease small subunit